jgi:hypothetical protein
MAAVLDADVTAVDDEYAFFPYGDEFTAHPDGNVQVTGSHSPYNGSFVQFLLKRENWKHHVKEKKRRK